ncbi:MAG: hypothetical protein KBC96_15435 [Armatimonadetes bacterium]|nr:hypothetical protein [Armatimonadota bacterium]
MSVPRPISITLDRRLLEHPQALHIRRMREAVWVYLALLARLPPGADSIEIDPTVLASAMGLPDGSIRSLLGHLRKNRYIDAKRLNGTVRVRVKHSAPLTAPAAPPRFFTAAKLGRALGEAGSREALERALDEHADPIIQRALAGALAVPAGEIRRSRTALFLYLLKRYANTRQDNRPRP